VMGVLNLPPGPKEMAEEVAAKMDAIIAGAKEGSF